MSGEKGYNNAYYVDAMSTRVIVLAAGKGTRMNHGIPKVLIPLGGEPIIQRLLNAVKTTVLDPRPVIVIGHNGDSVRRALGDEYEYVHQKEQLGTGHAVQCAEEIIVGKADAVIVLYGDHPFVRASTISELKALHEREGCIISMMTTTVQDFKDWRALFADFGRVKRSSTGSVIGIVEAKDATVHHARFAGAARDRVGQPTRCASSA